MGECNTVVSAVKILLHSPINMHFIGLGDERRCKNTVENPRYISGC